MKFTLKIILVILGIGGIIMVSRLSSIKYARYSSLDPELNITMDYISGWRFSEHRGSYGSYAQVQFYEPKKEGFAASMVVTTRRSSRLSFTPLTVEAMADDLLNKRMKLKEAKVLSKSKRKVLDKEAIEIQLIYKTLDKLYSVDARLIPVKERIVILKTGDKFYTLRYMNREEDFPKFDQAFSHCLQTLKLKQE